MQSDSDSDSNSDTVSMSEATTQCLIESMEFQIQHLNEEVKRLNAERDQLKTKIKTLQSILTSIIFS